MLITMTSDEAHRDWLNVIEKAHSSHAEIIIKQQNRPAVVVVNYEMWQMMSSQRCQYLRRLAQEVKAGNFYTQEEVEQGLRERGLL